MVLAKINIIPKMKQTQPELVSKLELYQDKMYRCISIRIHRPQNTNIIKPITTNRLTFNPDTNNNHNAARH